MPFTLVVGTDPVARRAALVELVDRTDGERVLVARTQALAHEIGRQLSRDPSRSWLPVFSWRRWVEGLWMGAGDGGAPADASVRDITITEMLGERGSAGDAREADVLDKVGGTRLLAGLVAMYPASALKRGDSSLGHPVLLQAAVQYQERLAAQNYLEFADIVDTLPARSVDVPAAIGVVGFLGLASHEQSLLAHWADRGAHVIVELPYAPGLAATRVNAPTVDALVARGASIVFGERASHGAGASLAPFVGAGLAGAGEIEALVSNGSLTLLVGEGGPAEVCLVADAVEAELASGTKADDIAVIVRQINTNIHRVVAEFERRNIPYAVNTEVPMSSTGLGAALVQLCDVLEALRHRSNAPAAAVLGPFLGSAYSGMNGAEASVVDARFRRTRRSALSAARDIAYSKRSAAGYGPDSAVGRLLALLDGADGPDAVARTWKLVSDELLSNSRAAVQTSWWGETGDLSAHAAFADILVALVESELPLSAGSIRAQINQAGLTVSPPTNAASLVLVASPGAVIGREVEALVIMGLSLGEAGTGLAGVPAERKVASQTGIDAPLDLAGERMLRDMSMLSVARRRVHLVWRALDSVSGPVEPAPLLEELLLGLGVRPASLHRAMRRVAELGTGTSDMTESELGVLQERLTAFDGIAPEEARVALEAARRGRFHGLASTEAMAVRTSAHRARAGEYADPAACAPVYANRGQSHIRFPHDYWQNRATSPSALEAYARCPYEWFLSRLVRLSELDDDYSAAAAGQVVHEILERFYVRWMRVERRGPLREEWLPRAREIFESLKAEVVERALEKRGSSWTTAEYGELIVGLDAERAWRIIQDDARGQLYDPCAAPFEPRYFEWRFGPTVRTRDAAPDEQRELDEHEGAIAIGGIPIAGSIDRIDLTPDPAGGEPLLAVLDYKSGSNPSTKKLSDVIKKNHLQVPIYLLAASRGLGLTPVLGAYVGYRYRRMSVLATKAVLPTRNSVSEEVFVETLDDVEHAVRDIGAQMRAGHIAPLDDAGEAKFANCKYCVHWWCPVHPKGESW